MASAAEKVFIVPRILQGSFSRLRSAIKNVSSPVVIKARPETLDEMGIDPEIFSHLIRQGFAMKVQEGWKLVKPLRYRTALIDSDLPKRRQAKHSLLAQPGSTITSSQILKQFLKEPEGGDSANLPIPSPPKKRARRSSSANGARPTSYIVARFGS